MLSMILTIISGVLVFFICEFVREVWLVPLREFHTIKSEICATMIYYAPYYVDPLDIKEANEAQKEVYKEASKQLRQNACNLSGFAESLYLIHFGIPTKEKIYEASKQLIGLSNGLYTAFGKGHDLDQGEHNEGRVTKIKDALGIYYKRNE